MLGSNRAKKVSSVQNCACDHEVSEQEQKGKMPQHGCNHGFHSTFGHDSWFSGSVSVRWCSCTASRTRCSTSPWRASVSTVKGTASEGSEVTSKTSGGSWCVMMSPWHKHICVLLQFTVKKCTLKTESPKEITKKNLKNIKPLMYVCMCAWVCVLTVRRMPADRVQMNTTVVEHELVLRTLCFSLQQRQQVMTIQNP